MKNITCIFSIVLILVGCSHKKVNLEESNSSMIYESALQKVKDNKREAIKDLEFLENSRPDISEMADIMVLKIYAYYSNKQFDEAIIHSDRFIKLYPNNKNTAYVYYMKGMSNYGRTMDVSRDQKRTDDAMQVFNDLIAKFPNSEYATAALSLFDHMRNMMAAKDLEIGKFYEQKSQYGAAAVRFLKITQNYQNTILIPEANYRMFKVFSNMELHDDAKKYKEILMKKYPKSIWTKKLEKMM